MKSLTCSALLWHNWKTLLKKRYGYKAKMQKKDRHTFKYKYIYIIMSLHECGQSKLDPLLKACCDVSWHLTGVWNSDISLEFIITAITNSVTKLKCNKKTGTHSHTNKFFFSCSEGSADLTTDLHKELCFALKYHANNQIRHTLVWR